MNIDIVGYVIVIKKKRSEAYEVLGYGQGNDPYPDELLRDRGAALFGSKEAAKEQIKEMEADKEKAWANKFEFGVMQIHKAQV